MPTRDISPDHPKEDPTSVVATLPYLDILHQPPLPYKYQLVQEELITFPLQLLLVLGQLLAMGKYKYVNQQPWKCRVNEIISYTKG